VSDSHNAKSYRASNAGAKTQARLVWLLVASMLLLIAGAIYLGQKKSAQSKLVTDETVENHSTIKRALSHSQIERRNTEQIHPAPPDPNIAQLLSQLADSSSPIKNRRGAGRALARIASSEALEAARNAIKDAAVPSSVKAAIAEGLGENSLP
jgi:hypothetical protein